MENEKNNSFVFDMAAFEMPTITDNTREEWIEYGEDNLYYNFLINCYRNSTTNSSIINTISRLSYGSGLMATDASRNPSGFAQMKSLFKVKDIKKVIKNTKMLGTGFWQVFYNANHTKIIKVNNIKTKLIRSNRCAENGEIEGYWFCQDWSDTRENEPKLVPAFGTSKESVELLAVGEESIDLKYYNEIDYEGALKYCVLEEEISDYLINEVANNFSGTKIVNFNNGGMSEEQQRQLANKVKHQLTGANGDKLIVSFNSGAENETTISDVPLNDAPAHYEYLSKEAQSKILNAHNVVSPYIVGITPEGQGFSSSADEIETANLFFHNGTISPLQDIILDSIKAILTFNGINLDVFFGRVGALYIGKDAEAKVKENEKQELSASIESLGEVMSDDWELIGDSEVDYDTEDELNANLESANIQMLEDENKTSLFGKIVNFATTGTANPNAKSAQDKTANGQHFKVRYKYTGAKGGERDFCNLMLSSGKVYRKEDIIRMGSMAVNAGFGENGADTYSIWLYKGGPRCHCKWNRLTFLSKSKGIDVKSPNASTVSRKISRKLGFDVINESKVSITPNNQPLKGFSPNNKNLPSDVK